MWPNQGPSNPAFPPGYNPSYPPFPPAGVFPQPPSQQYLPVQYPTGVNPPMIPNAPRVAPPYVGGPGPHFNPVAPGGYLVAPVGGVHPGAYPCSQKGYHHYKGNYHNKGYLYHGGVNPVYPLSRGFGGGLTGLAMGLVAHKAHKKLNKVLLQ
ncbi:splicing factor 3A subunit 2-like isoform X2 [Phyllopteryx taeniolatus]|uniref:splicing factor 3A subunit 2-like isoform X2 n=1 Tax=Phyllopteryx taeniolatus TaxID=161469 RepID=UPI002AD52CE8|nr:splicing factor 3A subunit 2-like isoform X2 [Phyllopteryx taeniolatus]